jgi:leucyl aminopeptidase
VFKEKMKHAIIFCLIACFYGIYADEEMRLIRFNESYTQWMTMKEVEALVVECGQKAGRGFIDITSTPDFVPIPQPQKVYIPGGPTHQAEVNRINARVSGANIWNTITTLSNYNTRYYTTTTGVNAVNWLEQQYRTIAGSRLGVDITVTKFTHSWAQPSLIVSIRGTKFPTQRVIIGGHIDSTAGGATARSPGADDDASGSACVLEVFRLIATDASYRPERTLEFQAYAAEEVGLRGSGEIAKNYYDLRYTVIGMLQLDMTGYVGPTRNVGLVTDYTNQVLTSFVRQIIGAYSTLPAVSTQCGYGCSDHASFYNYGFPASFTFETTFSNSNPYIHTASDTINRLNQAHAVEFTKIGTGFVVELGYGEN